MNNNVPTPSANNSGVQIPWLWIGIAAAVIYVYTDGFTGLAIHSNTQAVNNMGQQVGQVNEAVVSISDNQNEVISALKNLAITSNANTEAINAQGSLIQGVVDGLSGLATEVGGLRTDIGLQGDRISDIENVLQSQGIMNTTQNAVQVEMPTPVPLTQ